MNNASIYNAVYRMYPDGTYAVDEQGRDQSAHRLLVELRRLSRADLVGLIGDVFDRLDDVELSNRLLMRRSPEVGQ
jgi:hypothetical protein